MSFAFADVLAVPPAARTFLKRGFCHDSSGFCPGDNSEITNNQNFLELSLLLRPIECDAVLSNFKCDFPFKRIANHLSLPRLFKFLTNDTAQSDGFGHLIMPVWVAPASKITWKFFEMNRISCTEESPRFFSCEGKNWCDPSAQSVHRLVHDKLCRAATRRTGCVAIHSVFGDVDVERTQIDGAE